MHLRFQRATSNKEQLIVVVVVVVVIRNEHDVNVPTRANNPGADNGCGSAGSWGHNGQYQIQSSSLPSNSQKGKSRMQVLSGSTS